MRHEHPQDDTIGVSIIGAGERGVYFVGTRMAEIAAETGFRIVGVHDVLADRAVYAARHLNGIYKRSGIAHVVRVFDDLEAATSDPDVGLVLVTTHTNAHRAPVEAAVAAGKRVYLDKPIAVTLDDANAILEAERQGAEPMLMGFTRRYERPWIESVRMAHSGAVGDPQMILLRSVIPYTRYLQLWHRKNALSGGALNDKGSHHFDVLNWIAGSRAVSVSAVGGRSSVFKPDPNAPQRCSECDRECPYRRHETLVDRFEGVGAAANPSWSHAARIEDRNDTCVYLPGSDIDDHAIVTVRYENGISACLFFAIFGPWAEDQETLEIVGSSGRLRMERHSGRIDVVADHGRKHEVLSFNDPDRSSTHFGADLELVRTLRRFCGGERPPVGANEGLASLRLVLAAQQSLRDGGVPVDPETLETA
jgi:predicted dehydrogenase